MRRQSLRDSLDAQSGLRGGSDQRGLTLVDVLLAAVILVVPLVALMQVIPVSVMGMSQGKQRSIAAFLAEQKMEAIKAWAMSTATAQGFDTVVSGGTCFTATTEPKGPCQADNTIAGYPGYRRTATITTPGPIADTKQVDVTVFFRPVTAVGVSTSESSVQLSTLIAK